MESDTKYNSTFVNKLPLNQSDKFIIVESKWLYDDIAINILEYNNSETLPSNEWYGTLKIDSIKNTSEALERPYDEFYAECKNALCHPNGLSKFIYTIDNGEFTWKKDTGGTKIIYGRVSLTKSTENLHLQFLINSLDLCSQLRIKLDSKESKITELDTKHQQFVNKYDKYVAEKVQHDDEMLKKFLLLLNNKKSKIAELKQLLYEKVNAKDDSLTQSDIGQDSQKSDDDIIVREAQIASVAANVPTQINDELANDSSQSQELLSYKIPKRKKQAFDEIEETVKVRIREEEATVNEYVDSKAYDLDTQDMLENM